MKPTFIIVLMFAVLAFVIYLALDLHQKNEDEFISEFRSHQLDIASQNSEKIGLYSNNREKDIHLFSSFISRKIYTTKIIIGSAAYGRIRQNENAYILIYTLNAT